MPDDTVKVCPECDSSNVRTRSTGKPSRAVEAAGRHYCRECGHTTDTLRERPKWSDGSRSGSAKALEEMDVDDVPALRDM